MAIVIRGATDSTADVDGTTFNALRVTGRPVNYGSFGSYSLGTSSGTMAATLAANSEIFQFRWPDSTNLALVRRVDISAGALVGANAAALIGFRMIAARAWTTAGSGGARPVLTDNNCKLRGNTGTSLVNDVGISTTTGLTAGTKTLDAAGLAAVSIGIGTANVNTMISNSFLANTALFDATHTISPLILAQNEGFVLRSDANAFPITMTWGFSVNVVWAEVGVF